MTRTKETRPARSTKAGAAQPPTLPTTKPKGWRLDVPAEETGAERDRLRAQIAAQGVIGNARSLVAFGHGTFGELSLSECALVLKERGRALDGNDLSSAVMVLSSQAVALDAIFGELARRAALNMGEHLDATERYMRLALKAQGQCRTTLETLAAIKNPPVVFARQANINNGGQQQVNNGTGPPPAGVSPPVPAGARTGETVNRPNELLEAPVHGRT